MAHREFSDEQGVHWQVWAVIPGSAERRDATNTAGTVPKQRERRKRSELRVKMEEGLEHGWLVFESRHEKRRLHPIPDDWAERSESELAELLDQAALAPHTPRRLIE